MGALMYRCPTTSHHVKTAIDTEPTVLARMRNVKISVSCPHCIEGHKIPASEMYFEGLPSWPAAAFSQFEIALTLARPTQPSLRRKAKSGSNLQLKPTPLRAETARPYELIKSRPLMSRTANVPTTLSSSTTRTLNAITSTDTRA